MDTKTTSHGCVTLIFAMLSLTDRLIESIQKVVMVQTFYFNCRDSWEFVPNFDFKRNFSNEFPAFQQWNRIGILSPNMANPGQTNWFSILVAFHTIFPPLDIFRYCDRACIVLNSFFILLFIR